MSFKVHRFWGKTKCLPCLESFIFCEVTACGTVDNLELVTV
jgi:hypothetical protein